MNRAINFLKAAIRNYLPHLLISFIGLYSLDLLFNLRIIEFFDYLFLWCLLGAIFIFFYVLRFKIKHQPSILDYIKLVLVILVPFAQMIGFFGTNDDHDFLRLINLAFNTTLILVYIFDKLLTKLWLMNKRYVIVSIIQGIICLTCVAYAYVQQVAANGARRDAEGAKIEADMARSEAERKVRILEVKLENLNFRFDSLKQTQTTK